MPSMWNITEGLQREIREAREAAERHSTADELRKIVEGAHDTRRVLEVIWPYSLDDVQDDLDYLYAELQRLDPNALDEITDRVSTREIAAKKIEELARDIHHAQFEIESYGFMTIQKLFGHVMLAHIAADELRRLAGATGSAHARCQFDDAQDYLDYLYLEWRKATGEKFNPDVWNRLGVLDFRAISRENSNQKRNRERQLNPTKTKGKP